MTPIDYAEAKRQGPALKAKITRALRSAVDGRCERVVLAVAENILAWDEIGCWPDDWSSWQRAIDDVYPWPAGQDVDDLANFVRAHGISEIRAAAKAKAHCR